MPKVSPGMGSPKTMMPPAMHDTFAAVEELHGSDHADTFYGSSGADGLLGLGGDDLLVGADGSDRLHGYPGDDRLLGGDGDDWLTGDEGDDDGPAVEACAVDQPDECNAADDNRQCREHRGHERLTGQPHPCAEELGDHALALAGWYQSELLVLHVAANAVIYPEVVAPEVLAVTNVVEVDTERLRNR